MHVHVEVVVHTALDRHWRRTANWAEIAVVKGKATVLELKLAPHAIARAVALSLKIISMISPSTGLPDKLVVIEVIACAKPTISKMSPLSVLMVGVADWVVATTLGAMRLLVNV